MSVYFISSDLPPLKNVASILADWAILARLPNSRVRNRAFWDAVDAVEAAAPVTLAVIGATHGCTPGCVARRLVERRAKWNIAP